MACAMAYLTPNSILDLVCKQYFADQTLIDPNYTALPVLLGGNNPQCRIPEVQKNVVAFMLLLTTSTGVLSAIASPKFGQLSDRFGRRRLLALASCGGLLGEIVTILVAKYPETISYRWLILGAIFDGMTGSFTAGLILCQSYASDCTPPSKRAVSIGYIHACLFTGLAFGPLIAGYFVKWTGSLLSIFYVVMICHAVFILVVGFVIPESLTAKKRQAANEKWHKEKEERAQTSATWLSTIRHGNPFEPLKILWPKGQGTFPRLRLNLLTLAMTDTLIMGSSMASGAVLMVYAESTYNWGNLETSKFVSALSGVRVFVLMGVFPIINYFGRIRPAARELRRSGIVPADRNSGADRMDIWILRIALVSDIVGYLGYTVARDPGLFVASGMMTALGGLGSATTQAVVTKHVPSERIGQLLGAIGMLHALTRVIGPFIFNGLYYATVETFPQAIFVLLASLFSCGLLGTLLLKPHSKSRNPRSRNFLLTIVVHWEEDPAQEEAEPLNTERYSDAIIDAIPIDEDQIVRVQ